MDVLMDDTMYTLFWLCAITALCFLLYFVRRQKKKEQGSMVRALLVTVECVKPTAGLEAEYTVRMKYRIDDKRFCCYKPKLEKTQSYNCCLASLPQQSQLRYFRNEKMQLDYVAFTNIY
ncbi:hypothetical protein T09_2460 [Trichinella sp. T9]|nr:hypothetical protein T09_2460 [Trichinella sp. T9]